MAKATSGGPMVHNLLCLLVEGLRGVLSDLGWLEGSQFPCIVREMDMLLQWGLHSILCCLFLNFITRRILHQEQRAENPH